jgi:predicted dehydrogenase
MMDDGKMQIQDKKIRVAVIGTGARGKGVTNNLINDSDRNVIVQTVYDPDKKLARETCAYWGYPQAEVCDSFEQAIEREDIDWVMVFSPNAFHKEHILCAFAAGKHVFSEKPLATTIEDCQAIYQAHKEADGLLFATGFVLRYAPLYRKVRALLDAGFIGQLLSIDANENIAPAHGSYIMKNWRRLKSLAGPHILEKCCHDLDLLNWFVGSVPARVASFAGRNFFIPENQHYYDQYRNQDGKRTFEGWDDPHSTLSPFTTEKDMMDNQVAIMEYRSGVRVMFQATMSNAIPERRMYFSGTEGTMIAELYAGTLKAKRIDEEELKIYDYSSGGGHAGGDSFIMKELYDSMVNGTLPKCSGNEGLESAVVALAIEEAKDQNQVLDMEPIWKNLDR